MAAPEFDEEEEDDGLAEVSEDDTDVVFGNGPINRPSMVNFINKYPDSALRFLTPVSYTHLTLPTNREV